MPRISIKITYSLALVTLLCFGATPSFACSTGKLAHLFSTDRGKATTFCIAEHCLKRGQIHYENEMPKFPEAELPHAIAKVPAVLSFLADLSKHKTVAEWCIALKASADLQRPLFCDKPEAVVGAVPQEAQPFEKLILDWSESKGGYGFSLFAHRRGHCEQTAQLYWDGTKQRMMVDSPVDLINFFFKRKGCKMVQPPVVTYDPTYWERRGMKTPK